MHSGCLEHDDYTVGWICALPKELTAARAMLDNIHPDLHVPPGDYNTYCLGSIGTHNIAIACLPLGEIGTNSAATVASRMLVTFRSIRFGLMVGIGGGVPGKRHEIQLGDVVVSMPTGQHGGVVQWDFGKSVGAGGGFERTGSLNRPPQVLMAALSKLISNHDLEGSKTGTYLADMMARYPPMTKYALQPDMTDVLFPAECSHVDDNETCEECDHGKALIRIPRSAPAVHYGLIASGNQVIKDGTKRDKISRDLGGVLCFEMEAAGLQNQFQCLVIRGICDYADSHKNKVWQEYAAVAAAAFAKELVMIIPAHEVANTRTLKVVISETVRTSMQAQRDEEQASKSLQTLRTSNYELFKARNPDRVDGTCQWFLEHPTFVEWRDRKTSSLLWLSADPGCGKSVLSKSLVDKELASSASRTTCYFFFKEDDPTQRSVSNAMCAILHQLLTQNKPLRKHALTAFDENGSELPYLFDTLWGILTTAVRDTEAGEVVCILDGLDECEKDGRDGIGMEGLIETLTSFFCNEQGSNSHRLKFLVTSRPYYDIERLFNTLVSIQPMARLSGEEEATHISKEIDLVIKVKVKDLVTYLGLPGSAISFLETELSKVTHRTYLWLKLIIELIRNDPHITTEKKLRKAISTMPRTVDDAYEAILKRSTDMDEAKKLLHIVVAATRPLTIQEMNFALAIDEHTRSHEDLDLEPERPFLTRIKNLCGLLVTVIDSKIYFIHETVKQFLLSTAAPSPQQVQRRRVPSYWKHALRLEESHHVLAEICLAYLLLPAFEYEPMMIDADINIHDFQKAIDEYSTEHKFLKYTAECWSFHFREAQVTEDSALIQSALHVCDTETKRFLTWFPIHWLSVDFSVCPSGFTDLIVCTTLGLTLLVQRLLAQEKVNVTAPHPDTGMTPLMWAAEAGSERIVRVLLDQPGVLPAEADPFSGRTPVWWAAVGGHEAVMRLLLHQEIVDPDAAESRYGRTPLSWAASLGNEGILRQLLRDSRVNPDSKGNNGRTPLSWAAGEGSVGSVRLLLERNADPNSVDNRHGWTPLAWAADKGHETIIQLLLACKCINPDPKDTRNGRTPLSLAAERGHEPVVSRLLNHPLVDPNSPSNTGITPLSWAAQKGHDSIVELLLNQDGVDPDAPDCELRRTPLSWAAGKGHERTARLLLGNSAVVPDSKSSSGQTPLSWAAKGGNEAVVKLLLQQTGVNTDSQDLEGRTPLSWAAGLGYTTVAQLLLCHPAVNPNLKDDKCRTPLMWAARGGYDHMVQILIAHRDVEPDSRDESGRTPLSWASGRGHEAVVHLLLEHKTVDPDVPCFTGRTPLSWAVCSGNEAVVRLLSHSGTVNMETSDKNGWTPLDWARYKGRESILQLLVGRRKRSLSGSPPTGSKRQCLNV